MRIEFNYTLDDLREVTVPEKYAHNVRRYRWRWVWGSAAWIVIGACAVFQFWLAHQSARLFQQRKHPPDDLMLELMPTCIPAAFVVLVYAITIWKGWRKSRFRPASVNGSLAKNNNTARIIRLVFWGGIGAIGYILVGLKESMTWHPSNAQLVLIRLAPWAVVIGQMLLLGQLQRRWLPRQQWFTQPNWRRPKTMVMEENGFSVMDALSSNQMSWAFFARARETENLLILVSHDGLQYVIPKRAFVDSAEVERCRALLQNMIPNISFLVQPSGFAVLPKPVIPVEPEITLAKEDSPA
jgi:hypothetical protein